jgi:3-methylcrotonyl-CoA carboxylase alpha subunit
VGPGVRFDSGVAAGSEVTVHYDPMLAKLITWGRDRAESIERMAAALEDTAILGVATNQGRLRAILAHPAFRAGELHTGFIDEHLSRVPPQDGPPPEAIAAAVAALYRVAKPAARGAAARVPEPWESLGPWRIGEGGA